ncbi:MAG TPA: hypothetical protein VK864_02685, partial [Longimicrobiales bacterium]|nr:hypothetical protein [Longimicrobiales bacterium]
MSPAKVTKRRKAPARKRRRRTVRGKIIVRMYDVGFGDAFLVFIPTSAGVKKVLIDCGSIKLTDQKPIKSIVKQIIHDVTDHGKARIDLVIGTHRHKDHVSGFSDDAWDDVEVGEVWMPWTEDPDDPEARRIRETQAGIAAHLQATFDRLGAAAPEEFSLIALNALSNESAMTTL